MAYPLLPAVPHVAPLAAPSVVSFGAPSDAPVELLCDTPSRADAPVTPTDVPLTYNDVRPGQRTSIAVACIVLPGPADKKIGSTLGVEAYNLLTRNEKTKPWVQHLKATYIVVVQVVCPERPLPDVKGTQTFASVFPQLGCPQKCIANATEDTTKCAFTDEEMRDLVGLSQRARRAVYTARDNAKWAPEKVGPTSVFCWPPWPWYILHGKTVENRMIGFKMACSMLGKGCSVGAGIVPGYGICPYDVTICFTWLTETRRRDPMFSKKRCRAKQDNGQC